jgi:hypothetical protein
MDACLGETLLPDIFIGPGVPGFCSARPWAKILCETTEVRHGARPSREHRKVIGQVCWDAAVKASAATALSREFRWRGIRKREGKKGVMRKVHHLQTSADH